MCTSLFALVLLLATPLAAQGVEAMPAIVERGDATRIRVWDAGGEPLEGLMVRVRARGGDGASVLLGPTAADGGVDFVPAVVGRHAAWVTTADSLLLVAPFDAVEPPARPWWFAVGLLIAAALARPLWRLRRRPDAG